MKDKYRDVLQEALKGHNCRYVEIRVEQTLSSSIRYRGKDLEEAGSFSGIRGSKATAKGLSISQKKKTFWL